MRLSILLALSLCAFAETKAQFLARIEPHLPALASQVVLTRKCQDVRVSWSAWRAQFDSDEAAQTAASAAQARLIMARVDKDGHEHGMCADDDTDAVTEIPKLLIFSPKEIAPCPVD